MVNTVNLHIRFVQSVKITTKAQLISIPVKKLATIKQYNLKKFIDQSVISIIIGQTPTCLRTIDIQSSFDSTKREITYF